MQLTPIADRISQPAPEEIRAARTAVGLSQTAAARLISPAIVKPYRTWQNYEAPIGHSEHRPIPMASWELFLILTGQHPTFRPPPPLTPAGDQSKVGKFRKALQALADAVEQEGYDAGFEIASSEMIDARALLREHAMEAMEIPIRDAIAQLRQPQQLRLTGGEMTGAEVEAVMAAFDHVDLMSARGFPRLETVMDLCLLDQRRLGTRIGVKLRAQEARTVHAVMNAVNRVEPALGLTLTV